MERWFDLHLYLANWGTRRLMIRLPKRLVDRTRLDAFLRGGDLAEVIELGEHLILDIYDDCDPPEYDDWDDGSGWLGALGRGRQTRTDRTFHPAQGCARLGNKTVPIWYLEKQGSMPKKENPR